MIRIEAPASPSIRPNGGEGDEPVGTRNAAIRYGLGNLVENAVDFAKSQGRRIGAPGTRTTLSISIKDDGPGFSVDILGKIGDPYVSRCAADRIHLNGKHRRRPWARNIHSQNAAGTYRCAKLYLENQTPPESGAHIRVSWPRSDIRTSVLEWTKRHFSPITATNEQFNWQVNVSERPIRFCTRRRKNKR